MHQVECNASPINATISDSKEAKSSDLESMVHGSTCKKANKTEEGNLYMQERKGYSEEEIQNNPHITPSTRKQKNHQG